MSFFAWGGQKNWQDPDVTSRELWPRLSSQLIAPGGEGGRVVHHSGNVNYPTLNMFRLILSDSRHTHTTLLSTRGPLYHITVVIKKTFACLAACIENIRHFVSLVAKGKGPSRMRGLREPVCSRRAARCGTKKLSGPESAELLCRAQSVWVEIN